LRKRRKYVATACVVDDVVQDTAAQDRGVSGGGKMSEGSGIERHAADRALGRPRGDLDEFGRQVHAMDDVASARELDRVPASPATSIKDLLTRPDPAFDQPG